MCVKVYSGVSSFVLFFGAIGIDDIKDLLGWFKGSIKPDIFDYFYEELSSSCGSSIIYLDSAKSIY